ncbi:helix-turn-helix domain-containing protein [Dysosmobacter sp.]|uniref:helix-turn-helix domain-containing protein n=1 Tax=Dysosmobacter sp. TaxID=2591382 RepID=UPI002A85D7ED|nr:helix-turn-helix transcriptional regulator [Dysosmobacter sp.]MDY3281845.1 helix-turn-helix transcriptional regulator [Dysosmobacter sp.]
MTLGERILSLRKQRKLSQEEVGAILGVSRQAVSKWETDQSLPDTGNLLALAKLLGVTVEELTGTRPPSAEPPLPEASPALRRSRPKPRWAAAAAVMAAALVLWLLPRNTPASPDTPAPPPDESTSAAQSSAPETADLPDASLFWFDRGIRKHLSLEQTGLWDFGQDIATYSVNGPRDTDWPGAAVTDYLCSAPETSPPSFDTFSVTVLSVTDGETRTDTITALSTTSEALSTPRGIHVGSRESDVIQAYDDGNLCYHFKEHGSNLLCQHDAYYLYARADEGWRLETRIYILNGQVSGIAMENLMDGAGYDPVNNTTCFPVTGGAPDFSRRVEPEQEVRDDASLAAWQAFYALQNDGNLSPEEVYRYRRQLFSSLPGLDWQAYGRIACPVGVESPDYDAAAAEAQEALTAWLRSQEALSYDELRWLQEGVQSHPDGFLAEEYSAVLCHGFFLYPIDFTKALAEFDGPEADLGRVLALTAYGADYFPQQREAAAEQVRSALDRKLLPEQPARALLEALSNPRDETNG